MFNTLKDKIDYDLALIYAKIKLEEAISNEQFDDTDAPSYIKEIEFLHEEFTYAWDYYSKIYGKFEE